MKNLGYINLQIIFHKDWKLIIHPFIWHLWPVFTKDYEKGTRLEPIFLFPTVPPKERTISNTLHMRKYQYGLIIDFLCFTFTMIVTRHTTVGKIYPKKYDPDLDRFWETKYNQLLETDYFH
jgi:hypothetical protein